MITALAISRLLEIDRFVRFPFGQLEVDSPGGTEDPQEEIPETFLRRDRALEDHANLLFHRDAMPSRAVSKPIVRFVIQLADA
jgi:hypothetical protein